MGAGRRMVRFGSGGIVGAGLGSVVALLVAPGSGEDIRRRLKARLARARAAGLEAQTAKTEELIGRFRARVDDPVALSQTESDARQAVQRATEEHAAAATAGE